MGDSRRVRTIPSTRRLGLVRLGAVEPGVGVGRTLELWLVEVAPAQVAGAAPAEAGARSSVQSPQRAPNASPPEAPPRDRAVQRAVELMQGDLKRRWTVAALAKAVGVSRAVFARRFAAALGTSPIAHLTALRLARAAQRLTESDVGMAELGVEVGYESEFAFSRAFKRAFGLPPATFRRRQRTFAPAELEALTPVARPALVQPEQYQPEQYVVAPRCLALAA